MVIKYSDSTIPDGKEIDKEFTLITSGKCWYSTQLVYPGYKDRAGEVIGLKELYGIDTSGVYFKDGEYPTVLFSPWIRNLDVASVEKIGKRLRPLFSLWAMQSGEDDSVDEIVKNPAMEPIGDVISYPDRYCRSGEYYRWSRWSDLWDAHWISFRAFNILFCYKEKRQNQVVIEAINPVGAQYITDSIRPDHDRYSGSRRVNQRRCGDMAYLRDS